MNGERVLYDPRSNTFGVFTERGVPKTMFKPTDNIKYFERDRGKICGN
jgi:filamentous hemagglutinin